MRRAYWVGSFMIAMPALAHIHAHAFTEIRPDHSLQSLHVSEDGFVVQQALVSHASRPVLTHGRQPSGLEFMWASAEARTPECGVNVIWFYADHSISERDRIAVEARTSNLLVPGETWTLAVTPETGRGIQFNAPARLTELPASMRSRLITHLSIHCGHADISNWDVGRLLRAIGYAGQFSQPEPY